MALRDFLSARRSEIETQLKALKAELEEIRVAEAAINGVSALAPSAAATGVRRLGRPKGTEIRPGSIKDWIKKALFDENDGLETEEIISKINRMGGPPVPRNSMAPQLSRLKSDDGLITLEGKRWKLLPPRAEPDFSNSFGGGSFSFSEEGLV